MTLLKSSNRAWSRYALAAYCTFATGTSQVGAAAQADVYGNERLHEIEAQIVKLAKANNKSWSAKHEEYLLKKLYFLIDQVTDPTELAPLAIWGILNYEQNECERGLVNYDRIIMSVNPCCIHRIVRYGGPKAKNAMNEIMYQTFIDAHPAELLEESMSEIEHKPWHFATRVYVSFSDRRLEATPLCAEMAQYRVQLCRKLWRTWKNPIENGPNVYAHAELTVHSDGAISDLKVEVMDASTHRKKTIDTTARQKYLQAARKAVTTSFDHTPLPAGIKKTQIDVDFYGP